MDNLTARLSALYESVEYEEYMDRYFRQKALETWREQLAKLPPLEQDRVRIGAGTIRRTAKAQVPDPHAIRRAECNRSIREIEESLAAMPPLTSEHHRVAREVKMLTEQRKQSA